jgi:prepilin-type N-terminal cleavage/methylation domain-containing protein
MISCLKKKISTGFGLIEILVTVTILGLSLSALAGLGNFALKIQDRLKKNMAANYLAIETVEAVRAIKDESWSALDVLSEGSPFSLAQSGLPAKWSLVSGSEIINGFSRQITFTNVYRDSNDDITQTTSILDPNTKKVTVTVSWNSQGQPQQVLLSTYLTNWKPQ